MNRHFSMFVSTSSSTYGFKAISDVSSEFANGFPDIMQLNSLTCYANVYQIPQTAKIYATTAASTDQLIDSNLIGTVSFSGSSGTVTIVNNGKALSGK